MKKNRHLTCWSFFFYLFSVTTRFFSFNTSCQKYLPNLMNAIWFYNLQKSCVFHSQLKWGPAVFHIWLEIQVPRRAVRGQHGLLHCLHDIDAAWQPETDTDWPASLHLSVFVSSRVIHPGLLKSVRAKAPRILQDTDDVGQYGCWVAEIERRLISRWRCSCHSDRKIKPPVSEGLNWVPALSARRWMDDHRGWNWKNRDR